MTASAPAAGPGCPGRPHGACRGGASGRRGVRRSGAIPAWVNRRGPPNVLQ
ncbi:hypothetical protein BURCENK562V_C0935 [Burkholderia cenocepacia K56-2Valvano]|nr:hypothetical protein BURCENK562V_C0935 [Burkholderia cenocepacia K56-2Valvano]